MSLEHEQLKATFASNQKELAEIFRGAFGIEADFTETLPIDLSEILGGEEFAVPGVLLTATGPETTYAFLLREGDRLLGERYNSPDPTQQNIIRTLAQEVGFTLLPESFGATSFEAILVTDLAKALTEAGIEDANVATTIKATVESASCRLDIVGPCGPFEAVSCLQTTASQDEQLGASDKPKASDLPTATASATTRVPRRDSLPSDIDSAIQHLPTYTKSLLRIDVPVTVKLASTKLPVKKVVEMSMGSIIQFDKSCEEPLVLEVAGHEVAYGEAVKVGDKFGLRITSVSLPPERFGPIQVIKEAQVG